MSNKFEQPTNNQGVNFAELQPDANLDKKPEGELTPEELERLKTEQEPELSPEEQLEDLEVRISARQEAMARLTKSIKKTKTELNGVRAELDLPPAEEEPPSTSHERDKLEKLKAEQGKLEEQKEALVRQQEKEQLIQEAKEKILQEKIDELSEEFGALGSDDFDSILKSGKTLEGRNFESRSMGNLDPETAQHLAQVFKEGIELLPKILEKLPELLKKFDEELTKEATERVDKKLEEEKQNLEKEEEKEPEVSEDEITPGGVKSDASPLDSGGVEKPEA